MAAVWRILLCFLAAASYSAPAANAASRSHAHSDNTKAVAASQQQATSALDKQVHRSPSRLLYVTRHLGTLSDFKAVCNALECNWLAFNPQAFLPHGESAQPDCIVCLYVGKILESGASIFWTDARLQWPR